MRRQTTGIVILLASSELDGLCSVFSVPDSRDHKPVRISGIEKELVRQLRHTVKNIRPCGQDQRQPKMKVR
ncbi:hypothetical protein L596_025232 [Steinernema carpocapsae]|uniref:Uncharacterized protein n=1 Tax=Steinernema carpocapsae TaxID=34508 RepID=A0A4U5M790_STECR|nr:hypothetical protein L596_025232 [Steinernema carpocapsae]